MSAQAVLASGWTDPGSLGYPVLFGGVLLGSVVPVVPTGAVVGAAAAVAVTQSAGIKEVAGKVRNRREREGSPPSQPRGADVTPRPPAKQSTPNTKLSAPNNANR